MKIITLKTELKNKILYVDMDGTLAEWLNVPIEVVTKEGYFVNLPIVESIVSVINQIIIERLCNVKILTSVFPDNHSIKEKTIWIEKYLPELVNNMIFVPYGSNKNDYINVSSNTFLLDDFSYNLHEWEKAGGIGIKCYNGINGTKGTWKGYSINSKSSGNVIYNTLVGLMLLS